MQPLIRSRNGKEIEHPPHAYLAKIIRMTTVSKKSGLDKWLRNFLARRDLPFLILLKRPHLLVSDDFTNKEYQKLGYRYSINPNKRRIAS